MMTLDLLVLTPLDINWNDRKAGAEDTCKPTQSPARWSTLAVVWGFSQGHDWLTHRGLSVVARSSNEQGERRRKTEEADRQTERNRDRARQRRG